MRLTEGIIVYINFDGDIPFEQTGTSVFYGKDYEREAKQLVSLALEAMNNYCKKEHSRNAEFTDEFGNDISILEILTSDKLLTEFMRYGGDTFGNWDIDVTFISEENRE